MTEERAGGGYLVINANTGDPVFGATGDRRYTASLGEVDVFSDTFRQRAGLLANAPATIQASAHKTLFESIIAEKAQALLQRK